MRRKCLVIGANGGMGYALVAKMLKKKYEVIGTYHNSKTHLESLKENMNLQVCYLDMNALEYTVPFNEMVRGTTDIIFAAGKELSKNIMNCSRVEMIEQYNINVFSPLLLLQNILREQNGCVQNIIFISSTAGVDLCPNNGAYALSKACLFNLVRMLDKELQTEGIRVNCIVPGWCETEMAERIAGTKGGSLGTIKKRKCGDKLVRVGEIVEMCMFLLSDKAKNIHGQFIEIDVPEKRNRV